MQQIIRDCPIVDSFYTCVFEKLHDSSICNECALGLISDLMLYLADLRSLKEGCVADLNETSV